MMQQSKKYVFFVITFGSIYDRVLPLIEEKKEKGEIIVVATTDQIEAFFRKYTDFTVIRTKVHPDLITRNTKYLLLINSIKSKIEYRRLFKHIQGADVYFCNVGYAMVIYSYIKKLGKNNRVFYYGDTPISQDPAINKSLLQYTVEKSVRTFLMRQATKWLLGIPTIVRTNMNIPFWVLDESFFDTVFVIDKYVGDKSSLNKYVGKIKELQGKKILVATEDAVACGNIDEPNFTEYMNRLKDILDMIAPGQYALKPHPRLDKLFGDMKKVDAVIPPYIPFEFVLNHKWESIIGINSLALIHSSLMTDAPVFSIIDAVNFKDKKVQQMFRSWLSKESKDAIRFPSSLDELKESLLEISKKKEQVL